MKINIKNIAKINYAEIVVDGITVITGKNSTGKTTIGKSFFAIFNAMFDKDNKLEQARDKYLSRNISISTRKFLPESDNDIYFVEDRLFSRAFLRELKNEIKNNYSSSNLRTIIFNFVKKYFEKRNYSIECIDIAGYCDDILNRVNNIYQIDNNQLLKEIIDRYFEPTFNGQINSLLNDERSEIVLKIKDKDIDVLFENNHCVNVDCNVNILHEAFYINNPFVLDDIINDKISPLRPPLSIPKQMLKKVLYGNEEDLLEGLVDAVSAKEKLSKVYEFLDKTVPGSFSKDKGGLGIVMPGYKAPITFANLSTGIKSFAIIKLLLEKGALKEKDVLILDEPEIHLHPEWLLNYAEIIVLLQKYFSLSLIITTHSSDFLQAIEYYSEYHGVSNNCKYYLSYTENNMCKFKDVTENTEEIYQEMIKPSILLDNLRYEMEEKNYE